MDFSKSKKPYSTLASKASPLALSKANSFLYTLLKDTSLISTYKLGKEVYNIRDKASNKVIGFLGSLVSFKKLRSLSSFIKNKARKLGIKSYFIIIKNINNNNIY